LQQGASVSPMAVLVVQTSGLRSEKATLLAEHHRKTGGHKPFCP